MKATGQKKNPGQARRSRPAEDLREFLIPQENVVGSATARWVLASTFVSSAEDDSEEEVVSLSTSRYYHSFDKMDSPT